MALILDFLDPIAERRRTVPSPARRALSVWGDALDIDFPLTDLMAISAATAESNDLPKQAPPVGLGAIKKLEIAARNVQVCEYIRAFAAEILLAAYASLRSASAHRLMSFEANKDTARGTLLSSKTKKPRGQNWP